jgi:hypothetical protein
MRRAALANNQHPTVEGEATQPAALEPGTNPETEQPWVMDKLWVGLAASAPILAGLSWCVWWLVRDALRERRRTRLAVEFAQRYRAEHDDMGRQGRPSHLFCGQGEAVTVAELLAEAREQGEGVRFNWPEDDLDRARPMRPYVQDQFPTAILPKVGDSGEVDEDWEWVMGQELSQTERLLMGELFKLGQEISSFVLRAMGADGDQSEPITREEEFSLGLGWWSWERWWTSEERNARRFEHQKQTGTARKHGASLFLVQPNSDC